MGASMTDKELLGYTEIHSRTERALFSPEHANRLLEMAGQLGRVDGWVAIHEREADILIKAARSNGHGKEW
jgi:hypothetical protein